ncbi:TadE/TadG family type IV pilus assembly protein [Pelagibacterium limicola]|uniref:TadE/TadG family type IV pilus assembly protein n=1 Tax=Pelagibacterium limicola TaxID=2791022 RepID=UPI0018AF9369|nr:TadE/TadG family type IV pilus assembly protein [Pelagibacterium limicola]
MLTMFHLWLRDKRASVAVEFAILAWPFFLIVAASVELGVKSFIQAELDRVLADTTAALSILASDAYDSRTYVENTICSMSGPVLDCNSLEIGAVVVRGRLFDYRNLSLAGQWNPGCGGDVVLIELTYPYTDIIMPFAVADIVETGEGKRYRSRTVLRREPVLSGNGVCAA